MNDNAVKNLRETESCAGCAHLNVLLRHADIQPPYAIACDLEDGAQFDVDGLFDAHRLICDSFESFERVNDDGGQKVK